jgi:stage V sporulation protein D (sporulation-specific penicillin-binding protein)
LAQPVVRNKKRLVWTLIILTLLFAALFVRTGYIIIVQGSELQKKALSQWTREVSIAPKRGTIYDANMQVLAQSASVDTVVLRPNGVQDAELTAQKLSEILEMDYEEVYEKAMQKDKSEVWLKRQITQEQSEAIRALKLAGVVFTTDTKRYYPMNDFLTQTLGFTTKDGIGQTGLEVYYEKYLKGVAGAIVAETDKNGNVIPFGQEQYVEAQDGASMVLTIDYVIQSFLESAVKDACETSQAISAQGIAMNPKTGEIYGMAVYPNYDLNDPPRDDIEQLNALSRNGLVVDAYEPGSTFKVFTTAAALDLGVIDTNTRFYDPGFKRVGGDIIKCWRRPPHGSQTLHEALQNSCNVAVMDMAEYMGKESFYEYLYGFGFGEPLGIDFPGESGGIVRHIKYVTDPDLARISFGQSVAVTPLQMVTGASAAINGGNLMQPYIVSKLIDSSGNLIEENMPTIKRQVISAQTSETMRDILESVVSQGSGRAAAIDGYLVGGKTGTAQKYDETGKIAQGKNIGSFIGFAPANDPEIICLILVDEPSAGTTFGSVVAAPFVREVLENSLKYMGIAPTVESDEGDTVSVPNVEGLTLDTAVSSLQAQGLTYQASGTGTVVRVAPEVNTELARGAEVLLIMSEPDMSDEQHTHDDALTVTVPLILGLSEQEARDTLATYGLKLDAKGSGNAYYQYPLAGAEVNGGETIAAEFEEGYVYTPPAGTDAQQTQEPSDQPTGSEDP